MAREASRSSARAAARPCATTTRSQTCRRRLHRPALASRPSSRGARLSRRIKRLPIRRHICTSSVPSCTTPTPGDATPVGADYAVDDSSSYAYGTTRDDQPRADTAGNAFGYVRLSTHGLSRANCRTARPVVVLVARAVLRGIMTRNASLRVGYRYRTGDFGYAVADRRQDDGARIRLWRRLFAAAVGDAANDVRFRSGSSATRRITAAAGDWNRRRDTAVRRARQRRRLVTSSGGPGSRARAIVAACEYVPELRRAGRTGRFSADVNGLFTPRMDFSAASVTRRAICRHGFGTASAFDTYTASARVRQALTSAGAVPGVPLLLLRFWQRAAAARRVPPSMERNGVRVGITSVAARLAEIAMLPGRNYTPEEILRLL